MFPTSLSPSRTADYLQCGLLYRFRTIDQIPDQPSIAAIRGTLVHSVLEKIFEAPAGDRSLTHARELFLAQIHVLRESRPLDFEILSESRHVDDLSSESGLLEHFMKPVSPLLETYFAMEDPNRLEPYAREMAMSVQLTEGFSIRGFIDRVDKSADGAIRVVDYKTGKAPGDKYAEKAMFQMRFYALAWWRMTQTVPKMLQLMYLGDGKFLRYEPSEHDLRKTEMKILAIRAAINSSAQNLSFEPSPSKLCNWCSYKSLCPAFGGTPPPLPDQSTWVSGNSLVEEALGQLIPRVE